MAVNYTPLTNGLAANAANLNAPLQELDDAIEGVRGGTLAQSAPAITSFTNAQHDHSNAANGGRIPFDSIDTSDAPGADYVWVSDGAGGGIYKASDREVGDLKFKAAVSDSSNIWLRLDGRTITNSGATAPSGIAIARANADMETLFTHLWDMDSSSNLSYYDSAGVASTKGASAAVDWAAGKQITLPDTRGRSAISMDNPTGAAAANRVTGAWADQVFGAGGAETHTLSVSEMPYHDHGFSSTLGLSISGGGTYTFVSGNSPLKTFVGQGGGAAHNNIQPTIALGNWFIYTGN